MNAHTRSGRSSALSAIAAVGLVTVLLSAPLVAAQARSLDGHWIRVESNNPVNDGMRLVVEGDRVTLTAVPPSGDGEFAVGQVVWRNLRDDGRLEVRGSDGRYYTATLTLEAPNRVHIDVDHTGAGYEQTWERAGPSIDGDWVLVAGGPKGDAGLRIRVDGTRAIIGFMPPTASRHLRTGDVLWRGIGAGDGRDGGRLESRNARRSYDIARYRLRREDRLDLSIGADGTVQTWARPGAVDDIRTALENAPGGGGEAACFDSSLPHGRMGLSWRWQVEAPILPDASGPYTDDGTAGRRRYVADIDRSYAPGLSDHFATLSLATAGSGWAQQREERDLSRAEFQARNDAHRQDGFRLVDLEGYDTPAGVRYAGVWGWNSRGVDWRVGYDLTSEEYGTVYRQRRQSGYRLVDVEAYPTSDGVRYAGIWYRSCDDTNWRQWRNMSRRSYQARVDSLGDLGFRVIDFESYSTPQGQRYAAIWERISGRAWRVRSNRTLSWFLNYHRQYVDEGLRLIDFESYRTAEGIRYAGVWAENDARYRWAAKDSVDATIQDYLRTNDLPGISVVIVQDGEIVYRRGFGWADREARKQAHSGTIYLTASVSKVVGATLAARLEERGVGGLDLSQNTSEYIRGMEPVSDNCWQGDVLLPRCQYAHTLEQLLAKTSCVHHYPEGPEPEERYYRWRRDALVQIWDQGPLPNCTPGRLYHYSTHGFTYVGAALEAVTGKDIAQLLEEEIARPLGLASMRAMFTRDGSDGYPFIYDRARAYKLNDRSDTTRAASTCGTLLVCPDSVNNPSESTDYENNSWKVLGGGIESHARDLARFGWKVLNGEVVSASVRDGRLWRSLTRGVTRWSDTTRNAPGVGLSWELGGSAGTGNERWAQHTGNGRGAGSMLKIWRDQDVVIAMLSNRRDHVNRGRVGFLNGLATLAVAAAPP